MKAKKAKVIIDILTANGFLFLRQKDSHITYKKDNTIVIVPYHGNSKEMPVGTTLSIIKQSGLDKTLFE